MIDELINVPAAAAVDVTVGVTLICCGHRPKSIVRQNEGGLA